jgi:hypothetical protein
MNHPILSTIDKLITDNRHSWLGPAAEQVRQWRKEDELNGIVWESSTREAGDSNKAPASNHNGN